MLLGCLCQSLPPVHTDKPQQKKWKFFKKCTNVISHNFYSIESYVNQPTPQERRERQKDREREKKIHSHVLHKLLRYTTTS